MKKTVVLLCLLSVCFCGTGFFKKTPGIGVEHTLAYFDAHSKTLVASLQDLQTAINALDKKAPLTIATAKKNLAACRIAYKSIEFFVEYFFEQRIAIFNGAPVYEVEEPYMEYQSPIGLQVMEGSLFEKDPWRAKQKLLDETEVLLTTAKGFSSFLYGRTLRDDEILESLRLELIRLMTLGITGYDAPQLKTSIGEAREALRSIKENLAPYLQQKPSQSSRQTALQLDRCLALLVSSKSFDDFDRLQFLTEAALPLQESLGAFIKECGLQKAAQPVLNYSAPNIFSKGAVNASALNGVAGDSALIALGKELFSEKKLSGNDKRNCASCHQPARFFTDGLDKSPAFNGHDKVRRNAPSLLYAAYQRGQFWDARSNNLEEQIQQVLQSGTEMNAGTIDFKKALTNDSIYQRLMKAVFPQSQDSLYSVGTVAKAIAAYETSLPVMTSAFDDYMAGNKAALSAKQTQGFNLFMGKAQCGTCHFAPLFNSLLPPLYNRTELESLGLTATANFKKPVADKDEGRFEYFPIEFYKGIFKTPTVRNSAKTAPYMHNGAFKTLPEVIEFYNRGGGRGLGLDVPRQTLSEKVLQLTAKEKAALIDFLESLTDKLVTE